MRRRRRRRGAALQQAIGVAHDNAGPRPRGFDMNVDDMIILSIDDHTIEPPDMFERHVPD
jgi:hypothetical protein